MFATILARNALKPPRLAAPAIAGLILSKGRPGEKPGGVAGFGHQLKQAG
jgi:hypothetical protein